MSVRLAILLALAVTNTVIAAEQPATITQPTTAIFPTDPSGKPA
jgi:hypothetical protein